MTEIFKFPSHTEGVLVYQRCLVYVFSPITIPFLYRVYRTDADNFWEKYCATCSLRPEICRTSGALGSCMLGNVLQSIEEIKTIQLSLPRHIIVLMMQGQSDPCRFGYERYPDSIVTLKLGNIYDSGKWCTGDVDYNYRDPLSIYNGYFSSIHNSDLLDIEDYDLYLSTITEDFNNMPLSNNIRFPEYGGDLLNAIRNPTSIEWMTGTEAEGVTDVYKFIRDYGYNYVKIS